MPCKFRPYSCLSFQKFTHFYAFFTQFCFFKRPDTDECSDTGKNEKSLESGEFSPREMEYMEGMQKKGGIVTLLLGKGQEGDQRNIRIILIPVFLDVEVPLPLQVDDLVIVDHAGGDQISAV